MSNDVLPLLIFLGMGALTDFEPVLSNPKTLLLGAAAQVGVFAALIGALGTGNYSAAKAGIIALTLSAARELQRFGCNANVLIPRARTRMNMGGPSASLFEKPEEGFDKYAPEHVAPLVAWLASSNSESVSGNVLQIWGGELVVYEKPRRMFETSTNKAWSFDAIDSELSLFFAEKEPIIDGFGI